MKSSPETVNAMFAEGNSDQSDTVAYYDQFAEDFEKIPFDPLIKQLIRNCVPEKDAPCTHVLDVGSGPGALAEWISKQGYHITCLDPSSEMTFRCRKKGLKAVCGTLDSFFADHRYNIVLAVSSLIHVQRSEFGNNLKRIGNLLEPGGILIISMLLGSGEKLEDPLRKGKCRLFTYYSEEELKSLFKVSEFELLESTKADAKKMGKSFGIFVLKKPG